MTTYKCYIVDDEPLALKVIEQHLSKFPGFVVAGKSTDPIEALAELKHLQPDLLFIDIQMPEITGRGSDWQADFRRPNRTARVIRTSECAARPI